MSADLFSPADVPFNLSGETLNNELTDEGARRAQAEAEAIQRKAQLTFRIAPIAHDSRQDVTLANGRRIVHALQPNGSQLAYMADGGPMSDAEWIEYCGKVSTRAIRWPKQKDIPYDPHKRRPSEHFV